MKQTPIVFRIDLNDRHPVFSLKPMFVQDDSDFLKKFIDIADENDKAAANYAAKAAFLAASAATFPSNLKNADGEKIERPADCLDSKELIEAYFAERSTDNDWISEAAVNAYRSRHQPSVSFF